MARAGTCDEPVSTFRTVVFGGAVFGRRAKQSAETQKPAFIGRVEQLREKG
jgi:hypothetical protein